MTLSDRPYLPIAIGFYLLALPLLVAIAIEPDFTGRITNGIAATVMLALGFALQRRSR